ncbi:HAD family hydrolase [Microbacterium sp. bgisy203]|uniref:HAD family hydrolase n=1 Tax=Microbacterium sp. bgisy203 TaxID=3413799 RepID=UPI003D7404FE
MTSAYPDAVLWDLDGTLVDTEKFWMAAETALVESFGGSWTHEQALGLVGKGLETSAAILQEAGVRMATQEIVDHLTAQVMTRLSEGDLPWRPGALELLGELRAAGVRCALVTMSMRRMAELVVAALPPAQAGVFELIVSGDEATRPKPFPDAYLQACAALGVDPARALAIEDSATGVRAAVAAGVTTVGVPLMVSLVGTGAHAIWPTLDGRTLGDLADLHSARAAKGSAR